MWEQKLRTSFKLFLCVCLASSVCGLVATVSLKETVKYQTNGKELCDKFCYYKLSKTNQPN